MAKIDAQKEIINTIRVFIIVFITAFFSIGAYIFNNFEHLQELKLIFLTFITLLLLVIILILGILLKKEIKNLEEL